MIALLAARMRVEERLLMAAFDRLGHQASIVDPASLSISLTEPVADAPRIAIDRTPATSRGVVVSALLSANGTTVVNRTATTRLLADRLALLRHLIVAGIPVPATCVAFGEQPAIASLDAIGYPAVIRSLLADPAMPDATVTDHDAADAVIEHRATLGHETAALVQVHVDGPAFRAVIVGSEIVAVEPICGAAGTGIPAVKETAHKVISRLGSGVYEVTVVAGEDGPVVTGAGNLVEFRSLAERDHTLVERIAAFLLNQRQSQPLEGSNGTDTITDQEIRE